MVDVPQGMDNNTQHVPDLLGPLLQAHVVLSQHHAVNVSGPVRQVQLIIASISFIPFTSTLLEPICIELTLFL